MFLNIVSVSIAAVSLCFSGLTYYRQKVAEEHYNEKARKVIENSITLAQYDILILMTKSINKCTRIENYEFQVRSLKRNLETLKGIDISKLPADASMNYQVYINDLENIIYRISDGLNQLKQGQAQQDNFVFPFNDMIDSYSELFVILRTKKEYLRNDKNLFEDSEYMDNFNRVYEKNASRIEEGNQRMREKELNRKY